jgi:hypothetical protein
MRANQSLEPDASGYLHADYARSFLEWAQPRLLYRSKGWILERLIPGTQCIDAMGCYPLFCCLDWTGLDTDLEELKHRCISVSLVTDPFGDYSVELLEKSFDIVREYKHHFIVDPSAFSENYLARKHRRNLDLAMKSVEIERCARPQDYLDEWCSLYGHLCQRHSITGLRAFSRAALALQLSVPGLVMFRATAGERIVGLHLWYVQGPFGYGHLGATNELGYRLMASYALYWTAIEYFRGRVRMLDIGATPGPGATAESGLARFKRGWSTGTRLVYFCGRILDEVRYDQLCDSRGRAEKFFPAYRAGHVG